MTEQPIPMSIADPAMIDVLSMTQIILKAVAWKEGGRRIGDSKTNDAIAAFESANGRASVRMKYKLTVTLKR
jgi:hypothetical protein